MMRLDNYWKAQIEQFTDYQKANGYHDVEVKKQDSRGLLSITYINERLCVDKQTHFNSRSSILGYIQGYNDAKGNE